MGIGIRGTPRLRAALLAALTLAGGAAAGAGEKTWHAYDAAGRLVRSTDGGGRFLEVVHDAAGNPARTRVRRLWHVAVKKPAPGAWVFGVDDGGAVEGFGCDGVRGFFRIAGSLDTSGDLPTGTLELIDGDTLLSLAAFDLAGGSVVRDASNAPLSLVLAGADGDLLLSAKAVRPAGAFGAFHGTFAHAKNLLKAGAAKSSPGIVPLFAEGTRPAVTGIRGPVTGRIVRDPAGKAFGVVSVGEDTWKVTGTLKDGAKSVTLKSVKGSPTPFQLKVKR
jgi:YD repeat-containing protein